MRYLIAFAIAAFALLPFVASAAEEPLPQATGIFARDNLTAWCIVPFDAKKRGPEARAEMMARLGFKHFAYDWRAEHIPQFDEEIETLKRWGIELTAWWFPGAMNDEAKAILAALKRHDEHPQLWVTMSGGEINCSPEEHAKRVADHVAALRPIVEAAAAQGCKVGLYNHESWFGEPENELEILKALNAPNVGLVYNFHHGHSQVARFAEVFPKMLPYLYSVNLDGMVADGDKNGKLILPLGVGDQELEMLRIVRDSGYKGPIGILGHTDNDAELQLRDNLEGLDWLVAKLNGKDPGPRPPLHTEHTASARGVASLSPEFGKALSGGMLAPENAAFRTPPITVELRARLHSKGNFNILAACDTKASGAHWEIFTFAGDGQLAVYTPGLKPDHVKTGKDICDGNWHQVTMQYEPTRIRVYLDGELVADENKESLGQPVVAGGLGLGRLVEGGLFCDGEIDDVRISKGVRDITKSDAPLAKDADTIALWNFDDLAEGGGVKPEMEDAVARAALPEFQTIPAAPTESLTPALDVDPKTYASWPRSHGGDYNTRYADATQITKENVGQLREAWTYHSGDGPANIQCNPIVVDGVMYAPTSGKSVVAVDAITGQERWRFTPGGQPAFRGLTYWPGDAQHPPRVYFCAGKSLWALDARTGLPVDGFGNKGEVASGECRIAPAIFHNVLIIAGYLGDVYGFDVLSGAPLWTFHTIPRPGEPNADTWDSPEEGANCWGGIALDPQRGTVFISTGSPKPNFSGNNHTGQNLYANCVLAINALTGKYRWHFQELRHDIWDLDIPAPPILTSVVRDGKKIDVVAQVTKIGNTLVLDRETGKSLYPFRMRRAPVSRLLGERTWPYQPDIELPQPFARQVFTLDDITDRTQEAHDEIAKRVQFANHGWFETFEENKPTVLYGFHGGAEWTGACADPREGKLYVSANNIPWIVTVFQPDDVYRDPSLPPTRGEIVFKENCAKCHGENRMGIGMTPPLQGLARRLDDDAIRKLWKTGRGVMPPLPETVNEADQKALLDFLFWRDVPKQEKPARAADAPLHYTHNGYPKLLDPEGYPGCKPPWGTLNCIDLNTGKLSWQVPLGVYPDLAVWGDDQTGAENFGGPSVTSAGLVFCGGAADLKIRAFDSDNGAVLWEHDLPFGGYAPPTVYTAGGREYVLIPATGGGKLNTTTGDAYVAFCLP